MVVGAVSQIQSMGDQDKYLTGVDEETKAPPSSFFEEKYLKYTPFAMESHDHIFTGTPNFGQSVVCQVVKLGDFFNKMMLEVTLPQIVVKAGYRFRWIDHIGHHLIETITFSIGGIEFDTQSGLWMHIYSELSEDGGRKVGLNKMIGHQSVTSANDDVLQSLSTETKNATRLMIPLLFWFCRDVARSIPVVALLYQDIAVKIRFRPFADLCVCHKTGTGYVTSSEALTTTNPQLADCKLWINHVFVTKEERTEIAQVTHEYVTDSVQVAPAESISGVSARVRLPFTSPVKEIMWVVQKDEFVDGGINQRSNFTDRLEDEWVTAAAALHSVDPAGSLNPVSAGKLMFTGSERFSERPGEYFSWSQPYDHHTNIPESPGINVYSFALRPEEAQPTGHCNFSVVTDATMNMTLRWNDTSKKDCKAHFFALSHGVLKVRGGVAMKVFMS